MRKLLVWYFLVQELANLRPTVAIFPTHGNEIVRWLGKKLFYLPIVLNIVVTEFVYIPSFWRALHNFTPPPWLLEIVFIDAFPLSKTPQTMSVGFGTFTVSQNKFGVGKSFGQILVDQKPGPIFKGLITPSLRKSRIQISTSNPDRQRRVKTFMLIAQLFKAFSQRRCAGFWQSDTKNFIPKGRSKLSERLFFPFKKNHSKAFFVYRSIKILRLDTTEILDIKNRLI